MSIEVMGIERMEEGADTMTSEQFTSLKINVEVEESASLYDLLAREMESLGEPWMTTTMLVETTDKDYDPPILYS